MLHRESMKKVLQIAPSLPPEKVSKDDVSFTFNRYSVNLQDATSLTPSQLCV